jgi:hypothetical protein
MAEQAEIRRRSSRRKEGGRLIPRSFSKEGLWRFDQDRRRGLFDLIGVEPDGIQASLIDQAIDGEWEWLRLKKQAEGQAWQRQLQTLRVAAEFKRQWLLATRDLIRTIRKPGPPEEPPPSKLPDIEDVLAEVGR